MPSDRSDREGMTTIFDPADKKMVADNHKCRGFCKNGVRPSSPPHRGRKTGTGESNTAGVDIWIPKHMSGMIFRFRFGIIYRGVRKKEQTMIRKAAARDIGPIAAIYDGIHDAEEAGLLTTGWLRGIYPTRRTAEDALARDDLFVLEEDGTVFGAAILNRQQVDVYGQGDWRYPAADDEILVIHTLVIAPSASGRGLGREFIEFYEKYARDLGCTVLRLDTNSRNAAARRFYESLGYEEAGAVPTVFNGIPGVDLVLIEKRLHEEM